MVLSINTSYTGNVRGTRYFFLSFRQIFVRSGNIHSFIQHYCTMRSDRGRLPKMNRVRDYLRLIVIFLLGFYLRGIIDVHSWNTKGDDGVTDYYTQSISNAIVGSHHDVEGQSQFQPGNDQRGDTRTHWCIVAGRYLPKTTRGHFDHFPHAAEIILPCWSYFVRENVVDRCGYALAGENFALPPWIKELVSAMGCKVEHSMDGLNKNGTAGFVPANDIQHIPNMYLLRPRLDYFKYLDHPDHAHMLRRLFVDDDFIANSKGNGKPFQIGFIQRKGARRIDNLDQIYRRLKQDIPEANITITDFQFDTVKEQATWFATKDFIIGAHGAAITNSIFITPGTIVMQLYPPGYFLQTLEVSFYPLRKIDMYVRLQACLYVFFSHGNNIHSSIHQSSFPAVDRTIWWCGHTVGREGNQPLHKIA